MHNATKGKSELLPANRRHGMLLSGLAGWLREAKHLGPEWERTFPTSIWSSIQVFPQDSEAYGNQRSVSGVARRGECNTAWIRSPVDAAIPWKIAIDCHPLFFRFDNGPSFVRPTARAGIVGKLRLAALGTGGYRRCGCLLMGPTLISFRF